MIKIKYPEDINEFKSEYQKIFNKKNKEWYGWEKNIDCCVRRIFRIHNIKSLHDLLIAPFDVLLELFNAFPSEKIKKDINGKKISSSYDKYINYFNYDGDNQQNISKFFMENSKELNLKTCYFCNIDYINVFYDRKHTIIYKNILEVLNEKNKDDLIKLDEIGNKLSDKIISYKNKFINEIDLENINGIRASTRKIIFKSDIKSINCTNNKNHFTLDHFLPKGKCPILALSLYNFVPSCYACNSKFKLEDELLQTYLSPTSEDFSVNKNIKFKLYNKGDFVNKNFDLKLEYDNRVEKYVNTFKLEGRYKFHQNIAEELIIKQEKYPDSKIYELSSLLGIPFKELKKDIFGKELFSGDIQDKSFTKMKRDVAKNIGIKDVKDDKESKK